MKNEIILFNSPLYSESTDDKEDYLPPLGQGYIATTVQKAGIDVKLVDCVYERLGIKEIVEYINSENCTHIGFNVFSVNMELLRKILEKISRNVHIILGGKATKYVWQEIVEWNISQSITFIIGEGELIIPDIILERCQETPVFENGGYKVYVVDKESSYFPDNLDEILLDRKWFVNRESINRYGNLESCIITSRGCIYNCAFCGGAKSVNPEILVRNRSVTNIRREIENILALNPAVKSIRILDDLFLKNLKSMTDAIELFNEFKDLHWRCMAHVVSFRNAEKIIELLKKSGCDELFLGIESGSTEMRKKIHKTGSIQEITYTVEKLLRVGIDVKGYFILGFPGETVEQMEETLQLAKSLKQISKITKGNFRATVFQFRPYHGTELYNELRKENTNFTYQNDEQKHGSKKQYNFSAGNFSAVDDSVLNYYINAIINLG